MSNSYKDIVARAMTDEDFLNEFLTDTLKATSDYNLSQDEVAALHCIDRNELHQIGEELGERISKGYLDLSLLNLAMDASTDPAHNSQHTNLHRSTHNKG